MLLATDAGLELGPAGYETLEAEMEIGNCAVICDG
jgi:hypothetical protein